MNWRADKVVAVEGDTYDKMVNEIKSLRGEREVYLNKNGELKDWIKDLRYDNERLVEERECVKLNHKHIKFDFKYLRDIVSGVKVQTTRQHSNFNVEDLLEADFVMGDGELSSVHMLLEVTSVTVKHLEDLSVLDARREGFDCENYLKREVCRFYPDLGDASLVYCYQFRMV